MGLDKIYLSWWDIEKAIYSLASAIRSSYHPNLIVGISRGGLIPAVSLSHMLGVEMAVIDVKFYRDVEEKNKKPVIRTSLPVEVRGKRVLVVDDVSDTGETLKVVLAELKKMDTSELKIACLVMKPWTRVVPDFYVFRTDKWVVFPWEEFPVVVRE